MEFEPSKDSSVWEYAFERGGVEGTTGYFECRPKFYEGLESGLSRLSARPLDSFLRVKMQRELCGLAPGQIRELARRCLKAGEAGWADPAQKAWAEALASLMLECSVLSPAFQTAAASFAEDLKKTASEKATPFPYILKPCGGNEIFAAALRDLPEWAPFSSASLGGDFFNGAPDLEKFRGLLPRLREEFDFQESGAEPPSAKETALLALERLERAGLLHGPEMRHEASLSPIALLRRWKVRASVVNGRHRHVLQGLAAAFGRGLSLAQARASCLMEIVERACAHVSARPGGPRGQGELIGLAGNNPLVFASPEELSGENALIPPGGEGWRHLPVHWMEGFDADGRKALAPVQAVFLFSNLDEAGLYEGEASTGLASGSSPEGAKLAALTEIIERDAGATALFDPRACFILKSRDERIQSLLDDYHAKGIFPLMQDISDESGFPVYRCIMRGRDGKAVHAAGAGLDGGRAALSALTETPWPYSLMNPFPAYKFSARPPANVPARFLEDLPTYGFGDPKADLALLEELLRRQGKTPYYFEISREDLEFPVFRAFIPGMETRADYGPFLRPGPRFRARARRALKIL